MSIEAEVVLVSDPMALKDKGVRKTPGLVIDGEKLSEGRVPTTDEVRGWIQARLKT